MNDQLLSKYAPFGPEPLSSKIKVGQSGTPANIKSLLTKHLDRWTFDLESDIIVNDKLITTVTLYCKYGAFVGRGVTWGNDIVYSLDTALLNASDMILDFSKEEAYQIDEKSMEYNNYSSSIPYDVPGFSVNVTIAEPENPIAVDNNVSTIEPNTNMTIDPPENPPVFSSENLEAQPTVPHDGMTSDERNEISQEKVSFDSATPMVQENMNSNLGLSAAPTVWTDEYKKDVQDFMNTVECRNIDDLNNWLDKWHKGYKWNKDFTPAEWLDFRKFVNELLDSQTC